MPEQNPPSDHHYLPAFYLKRWHCQQTGKLTEFRKVYGGKIVSKPVSAQATGYEKGLYTLEGYEPETAQQVETDYFKQLDDAASKSLKMLERAGHRAPWNSDSRTAWTRFIRSLEFRLPEDVEGLRKWYRTVVFGRPSPEEEAEYTRAVGNGSPETFEEFLQSQPVSLKERVQFNALIRWIEDTRIGADINQMEWRVLEMPAGAYALLTSDRPVIGTDEIGSRLAHIVLPIGPRRLFLATPHRDVLSKIVKADRKQLVKDINLKVVERAKKFIWSCDNRQEAFVKKHFGRNPRTRLLERIFEKNPEL